MANKAGVPGSVRRRIFRRDDYTCKVCGIVGWEKRHASGAFCFHTPIDGVYLSIDHIKARSRGGSSLEENLRTLCTTCNTKKGTRPAEVAS